MKRDPRFLKLLTMLSVTQATAFIALHGVIWLLYMWLVLAMMTLKMSNRGQILRLVFSAVLPFGGFATALWINDISKK